jgi:hypothetical protein
MQRLDLGAFGGKTQRLGADAEVSGSLGQIEPRRPQRASSLSKENRKSLTYISRGR